MHREFVGNVAGSYLIMHVERLGLRTRTGMDWGAMQWERLWHTRNYVHEGRQEEMVADGLCTSYVGRGTTSKPMGERRVPQL